MGYCTAVAFILLVFSNRRSVELVAKIDSSDLIIEKNSTKNTTINKDAYVGVVKNERVGVIGSHTDYFPTNRDVFMDESGRDVVARNGPTYENHQTELKTHNRDSYIDTMGGVRRGNILRDGNRPSDDAVYDIELGREVDVLEERLKEFKKNKIVLGSEHEIDLSSLTVVSKKDEDLNLEIDLNGFNKKAAQSNKGELYAYLSPSLGVGAGIGESSLGAGAGGSAGLSAGIGEAVMNGKAVLALGGVGASGLPIEGDSNSNPTTGASRAQNAAKGPSGASDGVGGLVSGSGAGAAAGLLVSKVYKNLGLGAASGSSTSQGIGYNYDHLPRDGALHIMMHVDGSGSIMNTRKQLETMKQTILKETLLPYYGGDEELYNRRVTVVSTSGERTLRFFKEASEKENVLAIAFQDEAQPAYHLPNFNKKPENHYIDDLKNLKSSLDSYQGTYRGVMFQVDRGKTFAKSFKEFVSNAFRGEGYLKSANLKKYHRDNNPDRIISKEGIIFSDEYHAKDSGDPRYYLDLILKASKRVGLDLRARGAGLTDGRYTTKNKL